MKPERRLYIVYDIKDNHTELSFQTACVSWIEKGTVQRLQWDSNIKGKEALIEEINGRDLGKRQDPRDRLLEEMQNRDDNSWDDVGGQGYIVI